MTLAPIPFSIGRPATKADSRRAILWACAALSVLIFALDMATELGIASGVLYVAVIWAAHQSRNPRWLRRFAVVCSFLIVCGIVASPAGSSTIGAMLNRGMAIGVVWLTTVMCERNLRLFFTAEDRSQEMAEMIAELARHRDEQARRSRVMMSITEDLAAERERMRFEIDHRVKTESALRKSERYARSIVDSALDSVITVDEQGKVIEWNPQAETTFGWFRHEAMGRDVAELVVPPEKRPHYRRVVATMTSQSSGRRLRKRLQWAAIRRNGEQFPVELSLSALRSESGWRLTAYISDITERVRAEQVNARLAAIIRSTDDAIFSMSLDGIVTSWNRGAERLYGYPADEMIGQSVSLLLPEARSSELDDILRWLHLKQSIDHLETQRLHRDGHPLDVSLTISPLMDARDVVLGASVTARDISHQKRLEERFRATIESAPIAMVMIDRLGRIVLVNTETETLFGYERDELIGQRVEKLMPKRYRPKHPAQRAGYFSDPTARRMGGGRELFGLRKDGSEVPVEIGLNPIETKDGLFVLSAILDISERRRHELQLEQKTSELQRSNHDLEQFAYVASHDLQEPLRKVSACCQALSEDYADKLDDDAREWIEFAVDGARRMSRLISDLLAFARVGTHGQPPKRTDAYQACQLAINNLQELINENSATVVCTELPNVLADQNQLVQLFQNLIGNSLKYRDPERAPHIEIACSHMETPLATGDDRSMWRFSIKDNGIGIDPQFQYRIFEIFQRLHSKESFPGTGIGLAICKKITERLGGSIWIESQQDCGATFFFTLPKLGTEHDARHGSGSDTAD